jgi:Zn finger protein HypA/HybF involved in hydrogenase expression
LDKDKIILQYEQAKKIRIYCIFAMSTIPLAQYLILFKVLNNFLNAFLSTITFLIILRIYNKNWRCPSCKEKLPDRDISKIDYCPKCGIRLTE